MMAGEGCFESRKYSIISLFSSQPVLVLLGAIMRKFNKRSHISQGMTVELKVV
jgi:hypothetical protein